MLKLAPLIRRLPLLGLLLALWTTSVSAKEVAITIDDLPFVGANFVGVNKYTNDEVAEMYNSILTTIKKYNIKIVGFTIGGSIKKHHFPLLDSLQAQGHEVGNHTFTHPDLNEVSIDYYQNEIIKGEQAIQRWVGHNKYFRYPMLHRGDTVEKHDSIANFFKLNSYTVVPVTMDNEEYLFNRDYMKAKQNNELQKAEEIGLQYIEHMKIEAKRNVDLAIKKLKRDVKHILLIHMNEINANYLDQLLSWYQETGWKFITVEEALTDPVYQMKDKYIGKWGWSWLRRI